MSADLLIEDFGTHVLQKLRSKEMFALQVTFKKRQEVGNHWHDQEEFIYIVKGQMTLTFDKSTKVFDKGQYCVIKPGVVHNQINTGKGLLTILAFGMKSLKNPILRMA